MSSRLTETLSIDAVLHSVAEGISDALGFAKVSIELPDPDTGVLTPRSAVGWSLGDLAENAPLTLDLVEPLLVSEYEIEGCYLLTRTQARERLPERHHTYASVFNGEGPHAWSHHWLLVPLYDRDGGLMGVIWVDDPVDRLLPSRELLQALRVFANQATAALDSATHFEEMRFLAEHDPLTRLFNRRAFTRRLAIETARSGRYHRPFALVTVRPGRVQGAERPPRPPGRRPRARAHGQAADRRPCARPTPRSGSAGTSSPCCCPRPRSGEVRAVIDRISTGLVGDDDPRFEDLRASFGVAVYPRDGDDPETLFRAADEAMYAAKRSGERTHFAA